MRLYPTNKLKCFFILDITDDAYLSDINPSVDMCDSDVDHIYRYIAEGVYYPIDDESEVIGYFHDEELEEYITFYKGFHTDAVGKSVR